MRAAQFCSSTILLQQNLSFLSWAFRLTLVDLYRETDTHSVASFQGQPGTRNVRTLMKQETMGWQWHQLDHMRIICTSLQTDNHANTSSLNFLQAGWSSWCCRLTNSVKAVEANRWISVMAVKQLLLCYFLMSLTIIFQSRLFFRITLTRDVKLQPTNLSQLLSIRPGSAKKQFRELIGASFYGWDALAVFQQTNIDMSESTDATQAISASFHLPSSSPEEAVVTSFMTVSDTITLHGEYCDYFSSANFCGHHICIPWELQCRPELWWPLHVCIDVSQVVHQPSCHRIMTALLQRYHLRQCAGFQCVYILLACDCITSAWLSLMQEWMAPVGLGALSKWVSVWVSK